MTVNELETTMRKHSLVIRVIPEKVVSVYETTHKDEYPNGRIEYISKYKREMLVVECVPVAAGKFVVTKQSDTSGKVNFTDMTAYDTIEEALAAYFLNSTR